MSLPQLFMRLPELGDLPEQRPLDAGYELRVAVPADQGALASLLSEAFGDAWDPGRVAAEFSAANGVEATYVVDGPGGVAATASARLVFERYPGAGYVHYVGAGASERGRGLGEAVTRRVLVHFAEAGLSEAVLETDDFRLPAVRTYLRLGFVPEVRDPGDQLRWSKLLRTLVRSPRPNPTDIGECGR